MKRLFERFDLQQNQENPALLQPSSVMISICSPLSHSFGGETQLQELATVNKIDERFETAIYS